MPNPYLRILRIISERPRHKLPEPLRLAAIELAEQGYAIQSGQGWRLTAAGVEAIVHQLPPPEWINDVFEGLRSSFRKH